MKLVPTKKKMYMKLVNFVKVIDSFNVYSNILMLNFVIKEYFGLLLKYINFVY
jgi:hypothetical protein